MSLPDWEQLFNRTLSLPVIGLQLRRQLNETNCSLETITDSRKEMMNKLDQRCQSYDACPVLVSFNSKQAHQRSYSTPGPISTWMGDRLWAGKPSRYVTLCFCGRS